MVSLLLRPLKLLLHIVPHLALLLSLQAQFLSQDQINGKTPSGCRRSDTGNRQQATGSVWMRLVGAAVLRFNHFPVCLREDKATLFLFQPEQIQAAIRSVTVGAQLQHNEATMASD